MKRSFMFLIAVLCCVSFMSLSSCARSKSYNYTLEEKNGITTNQVKELKSKLDSIYEYFDKKGVETQEVKFIMSKNTRLERSNKEILIDFENISDFELMQLIIQYEFSEYVNYGLMYGVMYDISNMYNLEFEDVTDYDLKEIEKHWDYMFLSYINFKPEIASETEIKIAKYISTELVSYIMDEHGSEYLMDLMKKSTETLHADKVGELLNEWIVKIDPDFKSNRRISREVFNQITKENTLEYKSSNVTWRLHLNNKELASDLYPSIHENTQIFYDYMDILYDEMPRLENTLNFESSKLPNLTVELYPKLKEMGGVYMPSTRTIKLARINSFSHEFIHFIDDCLNKNHKYNAVSEMRAVYYELDFKLNDLAKDESFKTNKYIIDALLKDKLISYDPFKRAEKHLGRKLISDDFILIGELMLRISIEHGEPFPELFNVRNAWYPKAAWRSMFSFLIRNYGENAVDTILYEDKLPDGTPKNIDDIEEEWKSYIRDSKSLNYSDFN